MDTRGFRFRVDTWFDSRLFETRFATASFSRLRISPIHDISARPDIGRKNRGQHPHVVDNMNPQPAYPHLLPQASPPAAVHPAPYGYSFDSAVHQMPYSQQSFSGPVSNSFSRSFDNYGARPLDKAQIYTVSNILKTYSAI